MVVVLKKNKTKPSHKLQSNAGHCKLLLQFLNATDQPAKVQVLVYSRKAEVLKEINYIIQTF